MLATNQQKTWSGILPISHPRPQQLTALPGLHRKRALISMYDYIFAKNSGGTPTLCAVFSLAPVADMNLCTMAFWTLVRGGILAASPHLRSNLGNSGRVRSSLSRVELDLNMMVHTPVWRLQVVSEWEHASGSTRVVTGWSKAEANYKGSL